jgi:hypothetical protein
LVEELDEIRSVGIFPQIAADAGQVVIGHDDHRLDFRIVFDVVCLPGSMRRATTMALIWRFDASS